VAVRGGYAREWERNRAQVVSLEMTLVLFSTALAWGAGVRFSGRGGGATADQRSVLQCFTWNIRREGVHGVLYVSGQQRRGPGPRMDNARLGGVGLAVILGLPCLPPPLLVWRLRLSDRFSLPLRIASSGCFT
jgi:hypothetical protein